MFIVAATHSHNVEWSPVVAGEVQLTFEPYNHGLNNNDNFSPDDKWLAYDTRTDDGGIQAGRTIEKVHVETKESVTIYAAPEATASGPGLGAVSYHPTKPIVVFIHGLLNHSTARPYAQWRRFGMLIDESGQFRPVPADARDVIPPFTPGALRGGTHRHEFSGDGQWIGFTYNDALMADKGEQFNLRTIGVTKLDRPATINSPTDETSFNGAGTSALVVHVTPNPQPGSDDISRAAWDSWIGTHGYQRPDGTRQRARAFLGTVRSASGQDVQEMFVVDIPDDITTNGPPGPLEGTNDTMPMPPAGATQRRLTNTTGRPYPGFSGYVRSSPDGSRLACLAKDDNGIDQVVVTSSLDGNPQPLTDFDSSIGEGVSWFPDGLDVRWHPDGRHVCCSQGNTVVVINADTKKWKRITQPSATPPFAFAWSHRGDVLAFNRVVEDGASAEAYAQIFVVRIADNDLP